MGGYLVNFSLYTLAMVGVIFCALFVFKAVMGGKAFVKKSAFVKILDATKLSPRKTLYVIKAGNEKFLIASDTDRTTLISKLDENEDVKAVFKNKAEAEDVQSNLEPDSVFGEKDSNIKNLLNKKSKYDFLSKPKELTPKLKREKAEGLESLYGKDDYMEDEFASVLKLRNKQKNQNKPMMREIARKLHF
jgi:flagellar biogenesis protein FliO